MCTVLQCDVAVLSVIGGNEILVMRNGRLESRAVTAASPLGKSWVLLPVPVDCDNVVVEDSDVDPRWAFMLQRHDKKGLVTNLRKKYLLKYSLVVKSEESRNSGSPNKYLRVFSLCEQDAAGI